MRSKSIRKSLASVTALAIAFGSFAATAAEALEPPIEGALLIGADGSLSKEELLGYTDADAASMLLGSSSYFNVFLEGDFKPTGSDCEGRLAVGGSIINYSEYKNYMIGCALTGYKIAEKEGKYAEFIVGGDYLSGVSFVHGARPAESTPNGELPNFWYFRPRNIVVSSDTSIRTGESNGGLSDKAAEAREFADTYNDKEIRTNVYYYDANEPIIDFKKEFDNIRGNSKKWAGYDSVKAEFDTNTSKLVMTATQNDVKEKASNGYGYVFFDVEPEWMNNAKSIYVTVPEDCYVVMNVSGKDVDTYTLSTSGNASYNNGAAKPDFFFNDKQIGDNYLQFENNIDEATLLLTNFYEAETLTISNNFLGSILAPNADVDEIGRASCRERV